MLGGQQLILHFSCLTIWHFCNTIYNCNNCNPVTNLESNSKTAMTNHSDHEIHSNLLLKDTPTVILNQIIKITLQNILVLVSQLFVFDLLIFKISLSSQNTNSKNAFSGKQTHFIVVNNQTWTMKHQAGNQMLVLHCNCYQFIALLK